MKKFILILGAIAIFCLVLTSCTADEIDDNRNVQTEDVTQDVDPGSIKPPTGG